MWIFRQSPTSPSTAVRLRRTFHRATDITLVLTHLSLLEDVDPYDGDDPALTIVEFRLLFQLCNLTHLAMDLQCAIGLDDDDITEMARAWPFLGSVQGSSHPLKMAPEGSMNCVHRIEGARMLPQRRSLLPLEDSIVCNRDMVVPLGWWYHVSFPDLAGEGEQTGW
jgi:hypothetical protein